MYNECIQNFLNKTHPSFADRHSDSSDFEKPSKYFRVSAKIAIHTSKAKKKSRNLIKQYTELCNAHESSQYCISSENNILLNNMFKSIERRSWKQYQMEENKDGNYLSLYNREAPINHYIKRSHGNIDIIRDSNNINQESCKPEKLMSSSTKTEHTNSGNSNNKNNEFTNSSSIDMFKICTSQVEIKVSNRQRKKCYKLFSHPKKLKKVRNDNGSYTIHPIYVIERNEHNVKNTPHEEEKSAQNVPVYCNSSRSVILFAESEKEIFKRSYRILSSTVSKLNNAPNESIPTENTNASDNIKSSQYPLKRNVSTPLRMSPIYESKSVSTDLKITNKLTSSSSAFWNFLSDKVHRKYSKKKDYRNKYLCDLHNISCHEGNFENTESVEGKQKLTNETPSPDVNKYIHEINQTEFVGMDTDCQCNYSSTKLEILSKINQSDIKLSTEINKTKSQRKHETIAKALAKKYNGEILCIHNPPCVLINGCLNMSSSNSGHSHFWPVMTKRKAPFGHKNKKVKLSKVNKYDPSSQYQPSFSKLEECLPEFKTQNVQNKRSPCQVFQCRGAKGFKFENTHEPKFDSLNLLKDMTSFSEHNANCTKIPLSSKVYVVINANENNNAKAVCPHKPPCIMIPKCLARLISNNYIQVKSVPDCTHVPYCEKIPACFGKAIKGAARSKHSKSACHIV